MAKTEAEKQWDGRVDSMARGKDAQTQVARWTRHLMEREVRSSGGTFADALDARPEVETWPAFVRELFGNLYGLGQRELPEDDKAAGTEWIKAVLEQAQELPEWKELKARSEGDPWRCGLGARTAVDALEQALSDALDQVPDDDPEELQQDADAAKEDAEAAEQEAAAADDAGADDAAEMKTQADHATQEAVDAQARADSARMQAQEAAKQIGEGDGVALRKALRAAADEALEDIDAMDAAMAGLGHGHGAGALTAVNAPSEAVAEALRRDPKLRRIAAIAGRLRLSAKAEQRTKTDNGREEICDVEQGADLARLLPSETMLMADPETETLLFKKLHERQAMQYRMRGSEKADQGPIVVMLDGSVSMEGTRHEWAAAVGLALLEVAAMQDRSLALVHFGGGPKPILKSDVIASPRGITLEKLIEMVTYWGNSGTNIQGSLDWVGENLLKTEQCLEGADVLLVTDGASGDFSANIEALKEQYGASVYGIAIAQQWAECNREPLADYHEVTDVQIRGGSENIKGVLGL